VPQRQRDEVRGRPCRPAVAASVGWQGNCYDQWAEATDMNCEKSGCRCTETAVEASGKNHCSESCSQLASTETGVGQTCLCGHDDCANV
jgi:hypothetical protein